jgi:negative regulator of replication initiation
MTVRLPASLTERIDNHAESRGETRSDVMRRMLENGLAAESAAPAKPRSRPAKSSKGES